MSEGQATGTENRPAAAPPPRRAPMALVTWVFVAMVLVVVVVLLVVKLTRGSASPESLAVAAAPAGVVHEATSVPASAFDAAGAPPSGTATAPTLLTRQPPLLVDGRPGIVFVGGEFCPYCAAERWALVAALGRFGTFTRLGATESSAYEAFPRTATFSFAGASFHSRYVALSAVEEYGAALSTTAPAGFSSLQQPDPQQRALLRRYDAGGAGQTPLLPFVDVGNRLLATGAAIGFSPQVLHGLSMGQIAAQLSQPTSPVSTAVLGAANQLTAAICLATDQRPGAVCSSSAARGAASALGLP